MKRNVLLFFSPALLAGSLASCALPSSSTPSSKDVSSLEALTAMRMASSLSAPSTMMKRKAAMGDEDFASIKKALPVLEAMLEPSSEVTSTIEEGAFEVAGQTFSHLEIITFSFGDKEETFRLWYEETFDSEDEESFSRKEGLASKDEETFYPFLAESSEESEEGETESGQSFTLVAGESSFVRVEEEFEVENGESEHSLHYLVQENGILVTDFEVEIETEDNQTEIGIEIGENEYVVARIETEEGVFYEVKAEEDDTVLWTIKKETEGIEGESSL